MITKLKKKLQTESSNLLKKYKYYSKPICFSDKTILFPIQIGVEAENIKRTVYFAYEDAAKQI